MIITKLELLNFGPFKDEQTFELLPNKEAPVVIIMGHNGAGKTTLLEAIQLGVYGTFYLGLKNMTSRYQTIVKQKHNRIAKREDPEGEFSVAVEFLWDTGRETDVLKIVRRWWVDLTDRLYESSEVYRNNEPLDSMQSFEIQERIRTVMPPTLMEFFFFDGERIDHVLRNFDFSSVLREGAMNMFGLDIVSRLQQDLEYSFNKETYEKNLNADEKALYEIHEKWKEINLQYQDHEHRIIELENTIDEYRKFRDILLHEFKTNGGLLAEEHEQLEIQIKKIELQREIVNEKIKKSVLEMLPFQIVAPLLKQTVLQIEQEKQGRALQVASELVISKGKDILSQWRKKNDGTVDNRSVGMFFDNLVAQLNQDAGDSYLHDLSEADIRKVSAVYDEIIRFSEENYSKWYRTISKYNEEIASIRKSIEKNLAESALKDTFVQIEVIDRNLAESIIELRNVREKADQLLVELQKMEFERQRLEIKLKDSQRNESMVSLAEKIRKMMFEFEGKSLKTQTRQLSAEIQMRFTDLIQKKDYINSVVIDPLKFDIELQGASTEQVLPQLMSAGERQLLLLAILQAFIAISGRNMPLVLDTLMGRLDLKHRQAIISRFLKSTKFQTIILATDSEFSEAEIEQLKDVISIVYEISYKDGIGVTEVRRKGA